MGTEAPQLLSHNHGCLEFPAAFRDGRAVGGLSAWLARGLSWWMALVTSSLPAPLSYLPLMNDAVIFESGPEFYSRQRLPPVGLSERIAILSRQIESCGGLSRSRAQRSGCVELYVLCHQ
jgi:hypothetical protein